VGGGDAIHMFEGRMWWDLMQVRGCGFGLADGVFVSFLGSYVHEI